MKPTYEKYEDWCETHDEDLSFEEWKRAWEEDDNEEAAILAEIIWEEGRR